MEYVTNKPLSTETIEFGEDFKHAKKWVSRMFLAVADSFG